jgi:hypothetical protein
MALPTLTGDITLSLVFVLTTSVTFNQWDENVSWWPKIDGLELPFFRL